jgi:hypothetical protein
MHPNVLRTRIFFLSVWREFARCKRARVIGCVNERLKATATEGEGEREGEKERAAHTHTHIHTHRHTHAHEKERERERNREREREEREREEREKRERERERERRTRDRAVSICGRVSDAVPCCRSCPLYFIFFGSEHEEFTWVACMMFLNFINTHNT